MEPPDEAKTILRTPAERAACATAMVPSTFTDASRAGSRTLARTSIWAARWNTTSGRASARAAAAAGSRMSAATTVSASPNRAAARSRLARRPRLKSSSTVTVWPSSSSRSTRVDPMKPAPPVTRARMSGDPHPLGEPRHGLRERGGCQRPVVPGAGHLHELDVHPGVLRRLVHLPLTGQEIAVVGADLEPAGDLRELLVGHDVDGVDRLELGLVPTERLLHGVLVRPERRLGLPRHVRERGEHVRVVGHHLHGTGAAVGEAADAPMLGPRFHPQLRLD